MVLELAKSLGADALHTFLLVPVGCGVDIAAEQMVPPGRIRKNAELVLRSLARRRNRNEGDLRATLFPRSSPAASGGAPFRSSGGSGAHTQLPKRRGCAATIGPTEMAMPGSTGIELKPHGIGHAVGHPGTHPSDMNAMTKGCLAGTAVCFISHQGEVYPCGYLPALAGDLKKQAFADIWENSVVFNQLRDVNNLEGKMRLLRVSQYLHGMPRARLRCHRQLSRRGTVLRLPAADDKCEREGPRSWKSPAERQRSPQRAQSHGATEKFHKRCSPICHLCVSVLVVKRLRGEKTRTSVISHNQV